MRDRVFTIASVFLLVGCLGVATISWRGLWREFNRWGVVTTHDVVGIVSEDGPVTFWWLHDSTIRLGPPWRGSIRRNIIIYWIHVEVTRVGSARLLEVSAPDWFWVLATAIVPGLWIRRQLRRVARDNRCRKCGYDLTGNASGVCPECGTTIETNSLGEGKSKGSGRAS